MPASFLRLERVGDEVIVTSTYDPLFVEALKNYVPPLARKWDGETKTWTIDVFYEAQILKAAGATEFGAIHLEYRATNGDHVVRNMITGEEVRTPSLFDMSPDSQT